jgi:hypothetical protein
MLEGLFSQLANSTPPPITPVPPVPLTKAQREPLQATGGTEVPLVPSVPRQKTKVETKCINYNLSAADQQKLLDYMSIIGETDESVIDALLTKCAQDAEALAWALSWADKLLSVNKQPKTQTVTCRGCSNFKCYNAHGGGAGTCRVGVWTAGHSRWADDAHQCNKRSGDQES